MLKVIRFAINDAGQALFPDVFYFAPNDGEKSVEINGTKQVLFATYSMHSDLNALPEELKFYSWRWSGWQGQTVAFDEWRAALQKQGHAFKFELSDETAREVLAQRNMSEAVYKLWANGSREYENSLRGKNDVWMDFTKLSNEL